MGRCGRRDRAGFGDGWLAGWLRRLSTGQHAAPGVKTVAVPMFVNVTDHPELETEITKAAIAEVQKDGTLRVVPADAADAVLEVRLIRYTLVPTRFRADARPQPTSTASN